MTRALIPVAEQESSGSGPGPMLVGSNLLKEKLSSSGTGAGMQAAAREALEMARRTEEVDEATAAAAAEETHATRPPAGSPPLPVIDEAPFETVDVVAPAVIAPEVVSTVAEEAVEFERAAPAPEPTAVEEAPLSEDELLADLMPDPASAAPVAEEALEFEAVEICRRGAGC